MRANRVWKSLAILVAISVVSGCASVPPASRSAAPADACVFNPSCDPGPVAYAPSPEQVELDTIYTLLAYAVVYKNWQTADATSPRGYNIGSVLVDKNNDVVCWGVNSVDVTQNGTQHGEVRLIVNYLGNTRLRALKGYAVYTTLEPCAMCSGMMTLQSVAKTIYGQRDPDFGDAIQRLVLNSKSIGGYCAYPRGVISVESQSDVATSLDQTYCRYYNGTPNPSLTGWLASADAQQIYAHANDELLGFRVQYPANQPYLTKAQQFLAGVPNVYTPIPYTTNCPGS